MASCPHLVVCMGGVQVRCLIDTGSMVSTITKSCFVELFAPWGQDRLRACQWLQLHAANGTLIPYVGYIEFDIELCCQVIPGCGVLVVRDPPGGHQCSGLWYFTIVLAKNKDVRRLSSAERKNSKIHFPPATHRGNLGLTDRGPVVFHHRPCQWVQPDSCHRGG